MHQEKGFKFCLDTRNNRALPLDLAYPECLSVQSLVIYPIGCLKFGGVPPYDVVWHRFRSLIALVIKPIFLRGLPLRIL
jgi:hypothetical protein